MSNPAPANRRPARKRATTTPDEPTAEELLAAALEREVVYLAQQEEAENIIGELRNRVVTLNVEIRKRDSVVETYRTQVAELRMAADEREDQK